MHSSQESSSNVDMNSFMKDVVDRLSRLESALSEITRLKAALSVSEAARKRLEAQVTSLSSGKSAPKPRPKPNASSKPATTPAGVSDSGTPKATFAEVVAKNVPNKKRKRKSTAPPPPRRAIATVSRLFGPASDIPSGYQFVYYKNSVRRPLRQVRNALQACGFNSSRILDIFYPTGTIAAFLLHNDYVLEFTTLMHKYGRTSSPDLDFDPYDPVNLKDPKFASLSPPLRVQKAREVENFRCLRSISFVRRPLRVAVARSFLEKDRINQRQFDAILREELTARANDNHAAPTASKKPSKSSDEEKAAKKQRLAYLGFLLHYDEESARNLSLAPEPSSNARNDDVEMSN